MFQSNVIGGKNSSISGHSLKMDIIDTRDMKYVFPIETIPTFSLCAVWLNV